MISDLTGPGTDERKSYTTKLQRRAQAHITAELGRDTNEDGLDRQVVMLVQHALETTRARRVSLLRPTARGQRWNIVTALSDGAFHYGLVSPDSLGLPMAAYLERRPVVFGPEHPFAPPPFPVSPPSNLGIRSYLGLPLLIGSEVVAVLEVVNVANPDLIDRHLTGLEPALVQLTLALADEARTAQADGWASQAPSAPVALELTTVCDLVLRPTGDPDEPFTVAPDEWRLLLHLDGTRTIESAASAAGLAPQAAANVAARLLERGLIRLGKEPRRRG